MLTTWIVVSAVLILLELVVPGMVLMFLGAGALVVALLVWLGLVQSWISSITIWFIVSLLLLVLLRGCVQRLLPGEKETQSTDEDLDAFGKEVDVLETITPDTAGRISYRGATWQAACYEHTLATGSRARIVYRDELVWVVEPVETKVVPDS